jgi:hypothetical protein
MKQQPNRKLKFLYWLIPIIASVLIAFFKMFYKPSNPTTHVETKISTDNHAKTKNNNNGDVIGRDKVVNNYLPPPVTAINHHKSTKDKPKTQTPAPPPLVNNGNLSLNQTGGTVNQYNYTTEELPDRKLNDADKGYLKSIILPSYKVEVTIITSSSQETQDFGMELLGYLQSNYNVTNSTLIGISSANKRKGRKKFYVDIDNTQSLVKVLVQTQD